MEILPAAFFVTYHNLWVMPNMVKNNIKSTFASLTEHILEKPVVTCKDAARAKGIPLNCELKTLILTTPLGYVALELPGDATASLRKVKAMLEVKQAHLVDPTILLKFRLEPGAISALRSPVWEMPHLISKRLLSLPFLSTNSGHNKGYYLFHVSLLLKANKVLIGDYDNY